MRRTAALVLIDVQAGFHDPVWGPRNNPKLEERIAEALSFWRAENGNVIHIQHLSQRSDSPLSPTQKGVHFMEVATPRDRETIFQKTVNSAFIGTPLESHLRAKGIEELFFLGIATDHCVSTSVRMAKNLGFRPWVFSDATATFDRVSADGKTFPADLVHAVSLASLHGEFAEVIDVGELRVMSHSTQWCGG